MHTTITVFWSIISLAVLFYLWTWLFQDYFVDLFRQKLFKLRDELFDMAREKSITFDHPAYQMLRTTVNGYMRFGHRFTFWHLICFNLFVRKDARASSTYPEQWDKALKGLPAETKSRLETMKTSLDLLVFGHLMRSSPTFVLIMLIALAIMIIRQIGKKSAKRSRALIPS